MDPKFNYNENQDLDLKMHVPMSDIKVIEDEDEKYFIVEGLGSTFGNIDLVDDIVQSGAFRKTLINRKTPVKLLMNHDSNKVLGVWKELRETERGLFGRAIMPKTSAMAQEVKAMLDIGALDSLSIGFRVKGFHIKDGIRVIEEADLHEISIVTFPANPDAVITGVKNIDAAKSLTPKEIEEILLSSNRLSNSACKYLANCFQQKQCDAADEEETGEDDPNQSESEGDGEDDGEKSFWDEVASELKDIKKILASK